MLYIEIMRPFGSSDKRVLSFFLCLLLAVSFVPFFHCHAEGEPGPGHDHPGKLISYQGIAPVVLSGWSAEGSDGEHHTHHTHFLVDSQDVSVKSPDEDNRKSHSPQYFIVSEQASVSSVRQTSIRIAQHIPGSPLKDILPVFSGLSPPAV
jgi:hypothetical protein